MDLAINLCKVAGKRAEKRCSMWPSGRRGFQAGNKILEAGEDKFLNFIFKKEENQVFLQNKKLIIFVFYNFSRFEIFFQSFCK